jgi:hypothetical protein
MAPLSNPHFNGLVGIGTTSPSSVLSVISSGNASYIGSSTRGTFMIDDGSNALVEGINAALSASAPLKLQSGGYLYLPAGTSSVGVNTSTPGSTLDVNGTIGIKTTNYSLNMTDASGTERRAALWTSSNYIYYGDIDNSNNSSLILSSGGGNMYLSTNGPGGVKMYIDNAGNVGVGTTSPGYLLTVNGTAYAAGAAGALSDARHKKEVAPIKEGALNDIMNLRPVTFKWKEPKDSGMKGVQTGFIAQDVETVLPSTVLTQNDANKTKGLKYNEIVAVLTKAMQEQQVEIQKQKDEISVLKTEIATLKAVSSTANPLNETSYQPNGNDRLVR